MSAKRQNSRVDTVRDAVTGYTVIVLGLVCFLLVLITLMAGVRVVMELGVRTTATNATTTVTPAVTTAMTPAVATAMTPQAGPIVSSAGGTGGSA